MEDNFEMSWTAHVIYVDQKLIRSYDFSYEEAKQGTQRTIDRATSADAKPTPCEYCSWCKHYNNCHAIVRQAESAIALIPEATGNSIEAIKDRILASPESLGAFIREWKLAEKEIAEPLLGHLKTRLESGDEVAGWKAAAEDELRRLGNEGITDEDIMRELGGGSEEGLILGLVEVYEQRSVDWSDYE